MYTLMRVMYILNEVKKHSKCSFYFRIFDDDVQVGLSSKEGQFIIHYTYDEVLSWYKNPPLLFAKSIEGKEILCIHTTK